MIPKFLPSGPISDTRERISWKITTEPEGPSPWLPSTNAKSKVRPETAKQRARRETTLAETTQQVNTMIGEYFNLHSFSIDTERASDDSDEQIIDTTSDGQIEHANGQSERKIELAEGQIERADGQQIIDITSADGQIEHADGQSERKIELAERQIEHADGQIEHANRQSERQIELAEGQIELELSNEHSKSIDWPNNLVEIIKGVMNVPCKTPLPPEFIFELSESAASHNLNILNKYSNNLGEALRANENSPLGYGSEFRKPHELKKVFGFHPLWSRMESILKYGSNWPLEEISEENRKRDLDDALSFGNHKGAIAKPELLKNLINKDVIHGYSLPIPLSSVKSIPGLVMAPMNIMAQNTINELGQIIPKDRLTHNQSWQGSSKTSVNSRTKKELLQACRFGFCIRRIVNWAVAARGLYPDYRILATKIDYKSAYRRGHLHWSTALQTCTQLPDEDLAIITLRLTFGGAPCPYKWGVISESICDLANELIKCDEWDPLTLHASVQQQIPPREYLPDDVPLAKACKLIVDVPVDPRRSIDCYIDDTPGLTVDIPGTENASRLEAVIPLAIEVAARPDNVNEPIPRKTMVAKDKLAAEGGLSETKMILGWLFNFRTLIVSLPDHKFIAWTAAIQKMITSKRTTSKDLETTIGRMGHVGFVIPWVHHFLSRLRSLHYRCKNRRFITVNDICMKDLELMKEILEKAKNGIDMNLLAFRAPDRTYYSDSCPAGLGGYSDQGHAWRFLVPPHLQFRATNNLLEYLAAIITPWIDLLAGRLKRGDCALSMTDSTTAEGWMRKSNFDEVGEDPVQASVRADAAHQHARLFMDAEIKGYSQWFAGKLNNVADALSRDWHQDDEELTSILRIHFPQQMPTHFKISPLPNEINFWMISLLQRLPVNERLREEHMTTNLALGPDGKSTVSQLDAETFSWTASASKNEFSCSERLPWLSGTGDSQTHVSTHWLKAQSEVPFQMWCRPSGRREDRIPQKMQTMSLASFYQDNSEHSEMTTLKKSNKRPFLSQSSMS